MKWFLFLLIAIASCKQEKETSENMIYQDSSLASEVVDTRKGRSALTQGSPGLSDVRNSPLNNFFKKNVDQSGLQFYELKGLVYSGDVVAGTNIRRDSIRNKNISIIQVAKVDEGTTVDFSIDGFSFKSTPWADALEFNMDAFRHFRYKGNEYYYLQGNFINSFGGSMRNVCYHIIYMLGSKQVNYFTSCRFDKVFCFGDVDGNESLDYLDFKNEDFCTMLPSSADFMVNFYSCNEKGKFEIQKDKKGKHYFINGNSGENLLQDSFNISSHYWPLQIR